MGLPIISTLGFKLQPKLAKNRRGVEPVRGCAPLDAVASMENASGVIKDVLARLMAIVGFVMMAQFRQRPLEFVLNAGFLPLLRHKSFREPLF